MVNQRLFLWLALGAILYLNYETWMRDYRPPAPPVAAGAISTPRPVGGSLADSVPAIGAVTSAANAPAAASSVSGSGVPTPAAGAPIAVAAPTSQGLVQVTTDVLDVGINPSGAELSRSDLRAYPLHKDKPDVLVRLFNNTAENTLYVLQTGLTGAGTGPQPDHRAQWQTTSNKYELGAGAELRVPFTWTDGNGLTVTKTFVFKRGAYYIDLVYDVRNGGTEPRRLASYAQFLRHWETPSRSYFDVETYSFVGPAVYDGHKYQRLSVEKAEDAKFSRSVTNGWFAVMQHHFVSAVVPHPSQAYDIKLHVSGKDYLMGGAGPAVEIPAGATAQFKETLFTGPKLQSQLTQIGPELDRTVDYGHLTIIARPLFIALKWVHGLVGNWGFAIIIVTALIKLMFYPLSQASGRSMAKMRAVAPRMKQIQENFKDDREKLGRAMMDLYKREKINPVAGCLPMLVQIPFFISFYWVLLESVEMRQAPFMLWVNDLSSRDPFFVLPLLMGGAMFMQFKLNPPPPDPMQAKVMQFMPLIMTGMMAWFPSGLVLYWLTNTVLSIAQQWRINDVVEKEAAKQRS